MSISLIRNENVIFRSPCVRLRVGTLRALMRRADLARAKLWANCWQNARTQMALLSVLKNCMTRTDRSICLI